MLLHQFFSEDFAQILMSTFFSYKFSLKKNGSECNILIFEQGYGGYQVLSVHLMKASVLELGPLQALIVTFCENI